jgi:uncharacterized Tic20 family protein
MATSTTAIAASDRTFAMLAHLGGCLSSWIAPLLIYLAKKSDPDESFAADNAKEALNFQITVCGFCLLLMATVIGSNLLFIPILWDVILGVIAAAVASNGIAFRYPTTIRWIK